MNDEERKKISEEMKKKIAEVTGQDPDNFNVHCVTNEDDLKKMLSKHQENKDPKLKLAEDISEMITNKIELEARQNEAARLYEEITNKYGKTKNPKEIRQDIIKEPALFIDYAIELAIVAHAEIEQIKFMLSKTGDQTVRLCKQNEQQHKLIKTLQNQLAAEQTEDILAQAEDILNESNESNKTEETDESNDTEHSKRDNK